MPCPCPLAGAFFANALAARWGARIQIIPPQFMPAFAMSLERVARNSATSSVGAPHVLGLRHRFEVIGMNANRIAAEVIDDFGSGG
jgi:hypothetical protein